MKSRSNGIVLSYFNTALNMVTGLLLSSFLLRTLGQTEYGVYQTVSSFANYLVLFQFGTGTVMTRNISLCKNLHVSDDELKRNISTIWIITNILAIVLLFVSAVFYLSFGLIYQNSLTEQQIFYGKNILIFVTAFLILSFYQQTLAGIVLAFEQYTFSSWMAIIKTVSRTVLLLGLLSVFRYSILIAVVDMVLTLGVAICTFAYCIKQCHVEFTLKYFDKRILTQSLPLSCAMLIQTVVNQANSNVDKFAIGILLNPESVTLYSVGLYIYSIFSSITTIPVSMYGPQVAKYIVSGKKEDDLVDALVPPSRLIALIGGLILFGFVSVGRQFIEILYGNEYLLAWKIAIIIMGPMYLNMSVGILVNVLDVINKRLVRSVILLITTSANIVLTVCWIGRYGMIGASIATAIATLLGQVIIMNCYYQKQIHVNVWRMYKKVFRGIVPYQILGVAIAWTSGMFINDTLISFGVGGCLFILVSLGGFLLWGAEENEKMLLNKIIARFKVIK